MLPRRASVVAFSRVLLLLVVLAAMGAGSVGRASCATHGFGATRAHAIPVTAASVPGHAVAHHQQHGSSHDEHSDGCCCGGECSGVAQVASIPDAATVRVAVVVALPVSVFEPRDQQVRPTEPDRLLPFANGPPVLASV